MSWVTKVLQLGVAPILAGLFTLWAALVALAEQSNTGVPRWFAPGDWEQSELSQARSLHVVHLALMAAASFLGGLALSWWAWMPHEALLRLVLTVLLVWVVADLLPRLWAANEPELVRINGRLAAVSIGIFRPLLRLVAWVDGRRAGTLSKSAAADERELLSGVFNLPEMTVAEVMTPRMDVVTVDLSASKQQLVNVFRSAEHSRLLVVDGDPDNVVGVVYAKDVMVDRLRAPSEGDWHELVRPVEFVPDGKRLDRQLRDFRLGASHLVVVADEFGGTSGIVTLEDVLEQIVGEIQDERDTDEARPIQPTQDGGWIVQGGVALVDLEAELDHHFERDDVGTVGGLVFALAGRVPRAGEAFSVDGLTITVDSVVRRRVRRATFRRISAAPAEPPPGPADVEATP